MYSIRNPSPRTPPPQSHISMRGSSLDPRFPPIPAPWDAHEPAPQIPYLGTHCNVVTQAAGGGRGAGGSGRAGCRLPAPHPLLQDTPRPPTEPDSQTPSAGAHTHTFLKRQLHIILEGLVPVAEKRRLGGIWRGRGPVSPDVIFPTVSRRRHSHRITCTSTHSHIQPFLLLLPCTA